MNFNSLFKIVLLLSLAISISCSKKKSTSSSLTSPITYDVYAGGYYVNESGKWVAAIWKNGQKTDLTDGTENSHVIEIFVSGNDVYAVGSYGGRTTYWKNGQRTDLTGDGSGIFVNGSDVYLAGEINHAAIWKNEIPTEISDEPSVALSIFVKGTDVYAGGFVYNGQSNATLWKNGEKIDLSGSIESRIESVFVDAADNVYASGYSGSDRLPTIWKNGVKTVLSDIGIPYFGLTQVLVSGNNVHAVGGSSIFKNGTEQVIEEGAKIWTISVAVGDVYTGGWYNNGTHDVAAIWKNGVKTILTDGTFESKVHSIIVK